MAWHAHLLLLTPGSQRDVVLMHGAEPNMRWRTFCNRLLAIADRLDVSTVVILGALLADTPHTRPVPVSGTAYSPRPPSSSAWRKPGTRGPPVSPVCSRTPA